MNHILNSYIISEDISIIDTMKVTNRCETSVAFICDGKKLKAAVSDGDIRRYIISGGDIEKKISEIANYEPIYVKEDDDINFADLMRRKHIKALPVVNSDMELVDVKFVKKPVFQKKPIKVPVVIMAGGKGKRLKPYTDILPKPLIPIGDMTITERIMEHFKEYGCNHFDMIINYKKEFIKSYFQDNDTEYDINFVEEPEFWGTAGGLKLVQDVHEETVFITNCDILIEADYNAIYDYHKASGNILTLVCAKKKVVIPYGTVEIDDDSQILKLTEKPSYEFKTSTGLYLAEPEFIEMIPTNTKIHITEMIQRCIDNGKRVGTYLISEDEWLDMGQMEELQRMKHYLNIE